MSPEPQILLPPLCLAMPAGLSKAALVPGGLCLVRLGKEGNTAGVSKQGAPPTAGVCIKALWAPGGSQAP